MSKEVNNVNDDDDIHVIERNQSIAKSFPSKTTVVGSNNSVTENEISTSTMPKKRKRQTALRSDVWNDLERVESEDGNVVAICKHCKDTLNGNSNAGTTHLRVHIAKCKKFKCKYIKQMFLQPNEKKDGKVEYKPFVFDEERSKDDLAEMIVLHEYPLSIVDHFGFRKFVNNLQPLFDVCTRNTIKKHILKIYFAKRGKLLESLDNLKSRVAITTDMWTAKHTKKGFMSITAHYIDREWVLQNRILRFIYVPPPHTGEVLTEFLVEALLELNIDRKLSTITADNASSNDSMCKNIVECLDRSNLMMGGEVLQMRCGAHVLALIVKDGLDVIKKEIEKLRNSIVFWLGSRSRILRFEETARQLSIKDTKSLCLDCPTRWNSTYTMLETALLYKDVFPRLKLKDNTYTLSVPDDEDWRKIEKITERLKVFYDLTLLFSSSSCPTINEFFGQILKLLLEDWVFDLDPFISVMAGQMLEKYDKYWGDCHALFGLACVLDPRYKMKLVEFYHDDIPSLNVEKIRNTCYSLLKEYQCEPFVAESGVSETTSLSSLSTSSSSKGYSLSSVSRRSRFVKYVSSSSSQVNVKSELDHYLEESVLPMSTEFDVLAWWKTNGLKFPTLQKIARDVLAIPVTSIASESAFSTSGRLVSAHRSILAPNTLEALMCTQNW